MVLVANKKTWGGENMKLALVLILLLVGCTRYVEVPAETIIEKIYIENCTQPETIYINQTVEVDKVCPNCENATYIYDGNSSYILNLIQRINWFESQQSKYIEACESSCLNSSECNDELEDCEDTLEDLRDLLED